MSYVDVNCDYCNKLFQKSKSQANRAKKVGHKMYCSKDCYRKANTTSITRPCAFCGEPVTRIKSEYKRSKSGNLFCNTSCSSRYNNAQRDQGYNKHPNFTNGQATYRNRALKHYGSKCTVCGYDVESVLQVHHKDLNRKNNDINNLDVLCPTHHIEYHVGIRKYK